MTRVYVFCEGQTEETFVRIILQEYFGNFNIVFEPILFRTSASQKGGVSTYGKIRRQVDELCKQDRKAWVTTLLDYYGLPNDFPGLKSNRMSTGGIDAVEEAFSNDIGHKNFIANLVVHEFEGLLFSNPDVFEDWFGEAATAALTRIRDQFDTPEHINNNVHTKPSKRIADVCGGYDKVLHGPQLAKAIGLETIRQQCPRFDRWVGRLEDLGRLP